MKKSFTEHPARPEEAQAQAQAHDEAQAQEDAQEEAQEDAHDECDRLLPAGRECWTATGLCTGTFTTLTLIYVLG